MAMNEFFKTLWTVRDELRARGIRCDVECPGWLGVENSEHMYAPNDKGSWVHLHETRTSWTRLVAHNDPKVIARAITIHTSHTRPEPYAYS
jgi:hypothetical protein